MNQYKSGRLISEQLWKLAERGTCVDITCAVKTGDTMTGWEIIAGLPLEEQQAVNMFDGCPCLYHLAKLICDVDDEGNEHCDRCWTVALSKLYRWNGTSWEVVE